MISVESESHVLVLFWLLRDSLALLHRHIARLFKFLFVAQDSPGIHGSVYHPKYQGTQTLNSCSSQG